MRKILIVGGVAGGATAAARLRRLSEEDEIVIFERGEYISFANCGLPYYIGDVITDRSKLLVQTVEGMAKRFKLDIRNFSEVISIDRKAKMVKVRSTKTGETYTQNYDILILSPGAKPIKPNIQGIDQAKNLFVLRNVPDTDKIRDFIDSNKPKTALVIGGGFIGIEMAENLTKRGIKVTIVEKLNQVLAPFDFEMAQLVHRELNANSVNLILQDGVAGFKDEGRKVILESGSEIDTDMTILSIGVVPDLTCLEPTPESELISSQPENRLAKACGLTLGKRGHILTTKQLQTIDGETGQVIEDIYAIGDAAQITDYITGSETAVPLAGPANRQGRLAADHINGIDINYPGALGSSVIKVFSLTVASTGNNEKQLKAKGLKYKAIHAHPANHASYYPGGSQIVMKLLFHPDSGKIYGAQAVGKEGTEKRIDVIATSIKLGGTIRDLTELELCYAPPFSSAKDPVNILGYIACNVADNVYDVVHWNEIDDIAKNGGYLLDVRTPGEFNKGHIEGSVNIELDELRDRLDEISVSKDTPIYVNCQVGLRAYIAIRILKAHGFRKLYNLSGGYLTYKGAKYSINNYK
ncbi:MAG: FAD-dependent oxidoreductase [Thermoanaerobacteraceae bacterium]|nr:FAD-dependent oxidoreductase [Thermoanaerobacteraceae bacterium]